MSTNINISVGDKKLLDKVRLQQNASRQALLEKEANKKLSKEVEIERVNALAAQGKDANGNPIINSTAVKPEFGQKPAAHRNETLFNVGTFWNFYSRTTNASTLGPFGWLFSQIGNSGVVQLSGATAFAQQTTFYYAAGSGVPNKDEVFPLQARSDTFISGTQTPRQTIDSYVVSGSPPVSYKNLTYNLYNTVTTRNYLSSGFDDFAVIPTGKGNGILITINRNIASIEVYSLITGDIMQFDSGGNFIGYANSTSATRQNLFQGSVLYTDASGNSQTYPITPEEGFSNFEIRNNYSDSFQAYAINKNTIRSIPFPSKLKDLYLAKWPANTYVTVTASLLTERTASRWDYSLIQLGPTTRWLTNIYEEQEGFNQSFFREMAAVATPEIFKVINTDLNFTPGSNIKQYDPSKYQAIIEDRSAGLFSAYANGACTGNANFANPNVYNTSTKTLYGTAEFIDFAAWKRKGETPDYSVFNTIGCPITPTLPPVVKNRKTRTEMNPARPSTPNPTYADFADLIAIYDAGDPAYCKQMALEMGFTNTDLTP